MNSFISSDCGYAATEKYGVMMAFMNYFIPTTTNHMQCMGVWEARCLADVTLLLFGTSIFINSISMSANWSEGAM